MVTYNPAYQLPVFLPGSDDWTDIQATATVQEDGSLRITAEDPKFLAGLLDVMAAGVLVKLVFDYKLSQAKLQEINDQAQPQTG